MELEVSFDDPHCLEVWRAAMRRWWLYRNNRKSCANLLRAESREVREFIAEDDVKLRQLLELDAGPEGLVVEEEEQGRLEL